MFIGWEEFARLCTWIIMVVGGFWVEMQNCSSKLQIRMKNFEMIRLFVFICTCKSCIKILKMCTLMLNVWKCLSLYNSFYSNCYVSCRDGNFSIRIYFFNKWKVVQISSFYFRNTRGNWNSAVFDDLIYCCCFCTSPKSNNWIWLNVLLSIKSHRLFF